MIKNLMMNMPLKYMNRGWMVKDRERWELVNIVANFIQLNISLHI